MDRDPWNPRYHAGEQMWPADATQVQLVRTASVRAGRSAEPASGEDRHAVWSAARGWQVRAVDFATVVLANERRLADQRHGSRTGG
jgi:hypothetical protein